MAFIERIANDNEKKIHLPFFFKKFLVTMKVKNFSIKEELNSSFHIHVCTILIRTLRRR